MLTGLDIPGVVKVLSIIDERERGIIAYTMELLFGADLSQIFIDLPGPTVLEVFAVVCETLARLHEKDIVHRDIKSANIFVSLADAHNNRSIKLIDFGVAKVLQAQSMMESTATGVIVGTIQTLAPESIARLHGDEVELTWSVDQWGIGIALYHCLSGRLPFNNHAVLKLITDIQTKPTPPLILRSSLKLGSIESELEQVVLRCIAKDPADRFESMLAVADALRSLIAQMNGLSVKQSTPLSDRDSLSVITLPPSSTLRTDPARAVPTRRQSHAHGSPNAPTPSTPLSDRNTDREMDVIARSSSELSDTLIPEYLGGKTELDLNADSVETIVPNSTNSDEIRTAIPSPRIDAVLEASSPWSKKSKKPWKSTGDEPNKRRRIVGTADTLPSLPVIEVPNKISRPSQISFAANVYPKQERTNHENGSDTAEVHVQRGSGVPIRSVLLLVGVSIIISFALGWILNGL